MEEKKSEPGTTEPNANGASALDLEKLKAELEKAKNEYLYLQAEFDNYRKQVIKERSQLMKYGSERVFLEVLNVVDNFQRALQAADTSSYETFRKGMELIGAQLSTVLEQFGVTEVKAEGEKFDPMIHEALSSEESESVPSGHISRVFRKAYKLHDKVIRPAQVVVATEKKNTPPSSN